MYLVYVDEGILAGLAYMNSGIWDVNSSGRGFTTTPTLDCDVFEPENPHCTADIVFFDVNNGSVFPVTSNEPGTYITRAHINESDDVLFAFTTWQEFNSAGQSTPTYSIAASVGSRKSRRPSRIRPPECLATAGSNRSARSSSRTPTSKTCPSDPGRSGEQENTCVFDLCSASLRSNHAHTRA